MMEDLDIASERSELERESLVAAIRRRLGDRLLPSGICFWCQEDVPGLRLFCDLDCANGWEENRRRRGVK